MEGSEQTPGIGHPFIPRDLNLPDYVPIVHSPSTIVGVYALSALLVVSFIWVLAGRFTKITKTEKLVMCWWVFTGLTHIILEGYFVFSPEFFKEDPPSYLADLWKEYSKGDSRYVSRDSVVIAVEGITALVQGPASILAAHAIAMKKSYRYVLQVVISFGHLYSTAVYGVTSYLDGDNFATNAYYYYTYYIFSSSFWVWIPVIILIWSWKKICAAVTVQNQPKSKTR